MAGVRKITGTVARGPLKMLILMPKAVTEMLGDFHNNGMKGYFKNIYQDYVCMAYSNRRALIIEDFMIPHFKNHSINDDISKERLRSNFQKSPNLDDKVSRMYYINLDTSECEKFASTLISGGNLAGKYAFFGQTDYDNYNDKLSPLRPQALLKLACCIYLESRNKIPAISLAKKFTNVETMAVAGTTSEYAAMCGTYDTIREIAI